MTRTETAAPKKIRKQPEGFTFEKHYVEPLTDEEQNELADLIASIIFDSLLETASDKPAPTT
jgi:hypothetical protein